MKEVRKLLVVLLAAVFFIGLFVFCDRFAEDVRDEYASQINPSIVGKKTGNTSGGQTTSAEDLSVEKMVQDMITRDYSASVTLSAAGDIVKSASKGLTDKDFKLITGSIDKAFSGVSLTVTFATSSASEFMKSGYMTFKVEFEKNYYNLYLWLKTDPYAPLD